MVRVLFSMVLLVVILQPSHAADLCGFLDKVVASTREKTPFASVKYLDVPGGECRVDDVKGHGARGLIVIQTVSKSLKESWACSWNFPKKSESARLLDAEANFQQIREQSVEADRVRKKRWRTYERIDVSNPNYDRFRDEYRRAKRNSNRLRDQKRRALSRLNRERREVLIAESRDLHSRARKFVSSVYSCTKENKIRGGWGNFHDKITYKEKRFTYGFWWIYSNSMRVGIAIFARFTSQKNRQLIIEMWKGK